VKFHVDICGSVPAAPEWHLVSSAARIRRCVAEFRHNRSGHPAVGLAMHSARRGSRPPLDQMNGWLSSQGKMCDRSRDRPVCASRRTAHRAGASRSLSREGVDTGANVGSRAAVHTSPPAWQAVAVPTCAVTP